MAARRPIVVLTPVRNEAWILERFLAVTSRFADRILVADQGSTDGSAEICRRSAKVTLIENPAPDFNEADRQQLLLARARELIPGPKLLLALDADEILAADALQAPGWQTMLQAPPGTILCFEKPDLYLESERCIRFPAPWPLGYVDDGAPHRPLPIHSLRLPTPEGAPRLLLHDVKILHYALLRPAAQAAKMRYYSAVENLLGTQRVYMRRRAYAADRDWSRNGRLEPSRPEWFAGWEAAGIDMRTVPQAPHTWHDVEVLRLFARHGARRFWLDDVWELDWDRCLDRAREEGLAGLPGRVPRPPRAARATGRTIDRLYGLWLRLRHGEPRASGRKPAR